MSKVQHNNTQQTDAVLVVVVLPAAAADTATIDNQLTIVICLLFSLIFSILAHRRRRWLRLDCVYKRWLAINSVAVVQVVVVVVVPCTLGRLVQCSSNLIIIIIIILVITPIS